MRRLDLTLAAVLVQGLLPGCAGDGSPPTTESSVATVVSRSPDGARVYDDGTLRRLRELAESNDWDEPVWSERGMLEIRHVRTGLMFVLVPAGTFLMGSPKEIPERLHHHDLRRESVSAFLLSRTECSQEAWERGGGSIGTGSTGPEHPVARVSWTDCTAGCRHLGLRLPSEREWEYACRAGTTTRYWSGDAEADLARVGWYDRNSECTGEVGVKNAPNPWGLHDVHGNVWEWCSDAWSPVPDGRLIRGGSFTHKAGSCRSVNRARLAPDYVDDDLGFRPAADLPE